MIGPIEFLKNRKVVAVILLALLNLLTAQLSLLGWVPFIDRYGGRPLVLVFHTHGTESFMPDLFPDPEDRARVDKNRRAFTYDLDMTTVRLGAELAQRLEGEGIGVIHMKSLFDFLGRPGAYQRALPALRRALERYPSIVALVDLHRDASGTVTMVDGQPVARILIVIGTDRRLENPNWQENLEFARDLLTRMESLYPGISRGVYLKEYRYNQHLIQPSIILEVGGADNSLTECLRTVSLLAPVLADLISEGVGE